MSSSSTTLQEASGKTVVSWPSSALFSPFWATLLCFTLASRSGALPRSESWYYASVIFLVDSPCNISDKLAQFMTILGNELEVSLRCKQKARGILLLLLAFQRSIAVARGEPLDWMLPISRPGRHNNLRKGRSAR